MVNPCPMVPTPSCIEPLPSTPIHRAITSCFFKCTQSLQVSKIIYITRCTSDQNSYASNLKAWVGNDPSDPSWTHTAIVPLAPPSSQLCNEDPVVPTYPDRLVWFHCTTTLTGRYVTIQRGLPGGYMSAHEVIIMAP